MNYLFAEVPVSPTDPNHSSFINSLARIVEDQIGRTAKQPCLAPGLETSPRRLRNLAADHREWVGKELPKAMAARERKRTALTRSVIDSCAFALGFEAAAKAIENGTTLRDELELVVANAGELLVQVLLMGKDDLEASTTK